MFPHSLTTWHAHSQCNLSYVPLFFLTDKCYLACAYMQLFLSIVFRTCFFEWNQYHSFIHLKRISCLWLTVLLDWKHYILTSKYSWDSHFQIYLINNQEHKSHIWSLFTGTLHRDRQCQSYMKELTAVARGLDLVMTVFDPVPHIVVQTMH